LDGIFQALLRAFATEYNSIRDLQGLLERVPYELSNPLLKALLVMGKSHDQRGQSFVEAMLVLFVQLSMIGDTDLTNLEEVELD